MAKIANVALTNTFNTWRTNSNIAFDRLSQFAINNSSLYANTITANNVLRATGNTVLGDATKRTIVNGLLSANGRATVSTNLTVSGNTTLGAAGKTITSTGILAHTGNLTVSGNTSTNKATVTSSLTVSGNTTLGAAGKTITSTGAAAHTGTQSISTNLTVSGNTSTNKATVTSLLTVSGNTTIGRTTGGPFFGAHNGTVGATTANTGSFTTIGATGLATLSGRATVGTNLTVSGNTSTNKATVTSSLTVSGNTTLGAAGKTITSTGAAAHTGTQSISTNLTVSGNTTLGAAGKTITSTGASAHTGTQSISTNLTVSGNTIINASGANGVYSNTASFGVFSNNVNFSSKKIRNFTEDAMSYRASSTAITLSTQRNVQRVSLTGNATVTLPTGMPGRTEAIKTIVVIFKQDATGSRTMAFAAPAGETLLFNNSATLPAVSSAANKVTIYVCTKFDGDTRWYISQSFVEA